jgi:hypothetical protein
MFIGRGKPIVNFLIAGVQKGGTSSVDAWLRQHPQVRMARKKEIHYFDFDQRWRKDRWYHRYFDPLPQHTAVGEATPIYTYAPEAARRIWEYNAAMRLIVLFRHPATRAWSHWRMESAAGRDTLDFGEAIRRDIERSRENLPTHHRVYSYVDRGFYSEQIRRLRRFFPDSQLLFIKSEGFFRNPAPVMTNICSFLGIDAREFDTTQAHRVGEDRGQMPADDRAWLLETYRHDVSEVERLLGWNCDDWRV